MWLLYDSSAHIASSHAPEQPYSHYQQHHIPQALLPLTCTISALPISLLT